MNKGMVLYIMLFLLSKESSASIIENFFTFFAGDKGEQNIVTTVNAFSNYTLKLFRRNVSAQEEEGAFMKKRYFVKEDFKEQVFFNPFLTNRNILMTELWEDPQFAIEKFPDIKRYIENKATIIASYIYDRFKITLEDDKPVDIDEFAKFLAGYFYCLKHDPDRYYAQKNEMNLLINQCKKNILYHPAMQKHVNYFELPSIEERDKEVLTTLIVNDKASLEGSKQEIREFLTPWRKQVKKNEMPSPALIKELLMPEDPNFLQAKAAEASIKTKIKEIGKNIRIFSEFLRYGLEFWNSNPKIREKELAMIRESAYDNYSNCKGNYSFERKGLLQKVFFNSYLSNRYLMIKGLLPEFSENRYQKDVVENFDAYVEGYIRKNFIITMNGNDVTNEFLTFFPVMVFFARFDENMSCSFLDLNQKERIAYQELDEIRSLECKCMSSIDRGDGNRFIFSEKRTIHRSLAHLVFNDTGFFSIMPTLVMDVPGELSEKAFINRQIFLDIQMKCLETEKILWSRQREMISGFLRGELFLCQKHDRKNHKRVPVIAPCRNDIDVNYIQGYEADHQFNKMLERIENSAIMYKKLLINYMIIKRIELKNTKNQTPYGTIENNLRLNNLRLNDLRLNDQGLNDQGSNDLRFYEPLLQYLIERSMYKKFFPGITQQQYSALDTLALSSKDSLNHYDNFYSKIEEVFGVQNIFQTESIVIGVKYANCCVRKWVKWLQSDKVTSLDDYVFTIL